MRDRIEAELERLRRDTQTAAAKVEQATAELHAFQGAVQICEIILGWYDEGDAEYFVAAAGSPDRPPDEQEATG